MRSNSSVSIHPGPTTWSSHCLRTMPSALHTRKRNSESLAIRRPGSRVPGPRMKRYKALIGTAARIRVHDLPQDNKDITDWFTAGHSETELIALLEGVNAA